MGLLNARSGVGIPRILSRAAVKRTIGAVDGLVVHVAHFTSAFRNYALYRVSDLEAGHGHHFRRCLYMNELFQFHFHNDG